MAKIGIFDSGAGGLSVFREIRKVLPDEEYIYYSDSANCPYGEKNVEFIIDRCRQITEFLINEGVEIIVVACNTATAAAIRTLREEYPIKFIGMEPAIKPAAQLTRTGIVGVLATSGTLKSEKYLRHKEKYASDIRIVEHVGEGFVELVEAGITSGTEAEATVKSSVEPLLEAGADTIVLGCTHYPFLSDTIQLVSSRLVPDRDVTIIDPAPAVAKHLLDVMNEEGIPAADANGYALELISSGDPNTLEKIATAL